MKKIVISRDVLSNGSIKYSCGWAHFETTKDCGPVVAENILRAKIEKRKTFLETRRSRPFGRGVDITAAFNAMNALRRISK